MFVCDGGCVSVVRDTVDWLACNVGKICFV